MYCNPAGIFLSFSPCDRFQYWVIGCWSTTDRRGKDKNPRVTQREFYSLSVSITTITSSLRMSDLYKQNEFKGHHIDNTLDTIDISHYDEYSSNLLLRYFKSTFLRQCSTSWWNQFCVLLERNWKVCSSVESSFSIGVSAGPNDCEGQILSDDLSCCYCWNHFPSTWLWTGRICCSFLSILLGHSEPIRCSVLYYDESCFWTDL